MPVAPAMNKWQRNRVAFVSLLPFRMIGVGCDSTRVIHAKGCEELLETVTVADQASSKFLIMRAELR